MDEDTLERLFIEVLARDEGLERSLQQIVTRTKQLIRDLQRDLSISIRLDGERLETDLQRLLPRVRRLLRDASRDLSLRVGISDDRLESDVTRTAGRARRLVREQGDLKIQVTVDADATGPLEQVSRAAKQAATDLSNVGEGARRGVGTAASASRELRETISGINQTVQGLRAGFNAGVISQERFAAGMMQVSQQARGLTQGLDTASRDFISLAQAAGTAERELQGLVRANVAEGFGRINNEVFSLRNALESGSVSVETAKTRLQGLVNEAHRGAEGFSRTSREYRQYMNAAGGAERAIASLEGRVTRLGISQQMSIGMTRSLSREFGRLGPTGRTLGLILDGISSMMVRTNTAASAGAVGITAFGTAHTRAATAATAHRAALAGLLTNMQGLALASAAATAALAGGMGLAFIGLTRMVSRAAEFADELDKMSQRSGITTTALQEMRFVADQTGVSFDAFQRNVEALTRRIPQLENAGGAVGKAFQRLGIELRDSQGQLRNIGDVSFEIMGALANMANETERNVLASQLFGRASAEILPLLRLGSEGIDQMRASVHDLGLVMSSEAIQALVEFKDRMSAVQQQMQAASRLIAVAFLPVIERGLLPIMMRVASSMQVTAGRVSELSDRFFSASEEGAELRAQLTLLAMPLVTVGNLAIAAGVGFLAFSNYVLGAVAGVGAALGDLSATQGPLSRFIELMREGRIMEALNVPLIDTAALETSSRAAAQAAQPYFDLAENLSNTAFEAMQRALNAGENTRASLEGLATTGRLTGRIFTGLARDTEEFAESLDGAASAMTELDDKLRDTRLWTGRLAAELELDIKLPAEVTALLRPVAERLQAEMRNLVLEGKFDSEEYQEAAGKLRIVLQLLEDIASEGSRMATQAVAEIASVMERNTQLADEGISRVTESVTDAMETLRRHAELAWRGVLIGPDTGLLSFDAFRINVPIELRTIVEGDNAEEIQRHIDQILSPLNAFALDVAAISDDIQQQDVGEALTSLIQEGVPRDIQRQIDAVLSPYRNLAFDIAAIDDDIRGTDVGAPLADVGELLSATLGEALGLLHDAPTPIRRVISTLELLGESGLLTATELAHLNEVLNALKGKEALHLDVTLTDFDRELAGMIGQTENRFNALRRRIPEMFKDMEIDEIELRIRIDDAEQQFILQGLAEFGRELETLGGRGGDAFDRLREKTIRFIGDLNLSREAVANLSNTLANIEQMRLDLDAQNFERELDRLAGVVQSRSAEMRRAIEQEMQDIAPQVSLGDAEAIRRAQELGARLQELDQVDFANLQNALNQLAGAGQTAFGALRENLEHFAEAVSDPNLRDDIQELIDSLDQLESEDFMSRILQQLSRVPRDPFREMRKSLTDLIAKAKEGTAEMRRLQAALQSVGLLEVSNALFNAAESFRNFEGAAGDAIRTTIRVMAELVQTAADTSAQVGDYMIAMGRAFSQSADEMVQGMGLMITGMGQMAVGAATMNPFAVIAGGIQVVTGFLTQFNATMNAAAEAANKLYEEWKKIIDLSNSMVADYVGRLNDNERKALELAYRRGKISKEAYEQRMKELDAIDAYNRAAAETARLEEQRARALEGVTDPAQIAHINELYDRHLAAIQEGLQLELDLIKTEVHVKFEIDQTSLQDLMQAQDDLQARWDMLRVGTNEETLQAYLDAFEEIDDRIRSILGTSMEQLTSTLASAFDASNVTDFLSQWEQGLESITRRALITAFLNSTVMQAYLQQFSDWITETALRIAQGGQLTEADLAAFRAITGPMEALGVGFWELLNAIFPVTDSLRAMSQELLNVPTGYRIARIMYEASNPVAPPPSMVTGTPHPRRDYGPTDPSPQVGNVYGDSIYIENVNVSAKDPQDMLRQIQNMQQRQNKRESGDPQIPRSRFPGR